MSEIVPATNKPFTCPPEIFLQFRWAMLFGGLKGGLGKSTGAWLTGVELARRTNEKVLLVCADPGSQTLYSAYQAALAQDYDVPFEVISWPTQTGLVKGVGKEMDRREAEHLIIDVGGDDPEILKQACILVGKLGADPDTLAEYVLPLAPTIADLWRIHSSISACAEIEGIVAEPPAIDLLVCKANQRSRRGVNARQHFAERGWPVLSTQIPSNEFYLGALETVPTDGGLFGSMLAEIALNRHAERQQEAQEEQA